MVNESAGSGGDLDSYFSGCEAFAEKMAIKITKDRFSSSC